MNFKNWSNSYYTRSLSPYYYQVQPDSYDPENDTYALRLLQTGTDYISQSDITKEADQHSIWMPVWIGNVRLASII